MTNLNRQLKIKRTIKMCLQCTAKGSI